VRESMGLTGLQLSILDVLWERGEATTQDVWLRLTQGRPLALTTVATIMSRLERKRVLTHRRDGRQYVYRATVTRSEVRRSKVRELTENLFGGDPAELLSHLVRTDDVDADELQRIRAMTSSSAFGRCSIRRSRAVWPEMPEALASGTAVLAGWLLTYLLHSTALIVGAWLLTRLVSLRPPTRDVLWKTALIAGVVTSTASVLAGPRIHSVAEMGDSSGFAREVEEVGEFGWFNRGTEGTDQLGEFATGWAEIDEVELSQGMPGHAVACRARLNWPTPSDWPRYALRPEPTCPSPGSCCWASESGSWAALRASSGSCADMLPCGPCVDTSTCQQPGPRKSSTISRGAGLRRASYCACRMRSRHRASFPDS